MTTYAAFLRGVNLGSANRVSMPALRTLAEGLGYGDVRTYINSGNLVFTAPDSSNPAVVAALRRALTDELGLRLDVAVRSGDELRAILASNPFPDGNPSQVTVALLTGSPAPDAEDKVAAIATEHEPYTFAGSEIWVNYSAGIGKSKLSLQFSKIIGVSATVRNVRTIEKVVALLPDSH